MIRRALAIILSSLTILIISNNAQLIAYANDDINLEQLEEELKTVQDIENADGKDLIDIFNRYSSTDDSELGFEIEQLLELLSISVEKTEGIVDVGDTELLFKFDINGTKIVDVVQKDNIIYTIWYNSNKSYKIDFSPFMDFLYDNIFRATGLELNN